MYQQCFSYFEMNDDKDASDYLEPRSTLPIRAKTDEFEASWYGRLTGFWCNMVSTLRSSGRSRKKRRNIKPQLNTTTSNSSPENIHPSGLSETYKYVADWRRQTESHTYYNLVEDLWFHHSEEYHCRPSSGKNQPYREVTYVQRFYDQEGYGYDTGHQVYFLENYILLQYIGSFAVTGDDQTARAENVRKQLAQMREVSRSKPVLLVISLSGIKVCSSNGESVYMAHALKRISYATCDPEYCQFSFLAREPKGHTASQYCHAFITKTADEAEELNNIVGNAFKMAYAYQRQASLQPQQPTFNEVIQQQLAVQQQEIQQLQEQKQASLQRKLNKISDTSTIAVRCQERKERKRVEAEQLEREREIQRLAGKDRISWAKQIVGRTKHRMPVFGESPQQSPRSSIVLTDGAELSQHTDCDHSSISSSMLTLKEALEGNQPRSYGSPVMALKESIDNHFNGHIITSAQHSPPAPAPAPSESETYLYPVAGSSNGTTQNNDQLDSSSQEASPRHNTMLNRPLPATPPSDDKSKRKSKPSKPADGRKSLISMLSQKPHPEDSRGSPRGSRTQLNGQSNGSPARPPSVQYQNSSPIHDRSGGSDPHNSSDDINCDTMYAGPPTPFRYDSLRSCGEADEELKRMTWYQAGLPREIALEILVQQEIGSFIIRDSTTHPGCFALSVKVPKFENPTGISHYLIHRTKSGNFKLKGLDKEWSSLNALVTHHTVMPEMLPCTLRLPRNSSNPAFNAEDRDEREEDEDYQKLADFSKMMQTLKM